MFEEDPYFGGMPTSTLIENAESTTASVITRGRSIVQIGMRARTDASLVEKLAAWSVDPEFQKTRWTGFITMAWVSVCGMAYSQPSDEGRAKVREVLAQWDRDERRLLLNWSKHESWFDGV
ncbi:hypothetical protein LO763_01305 [Glycomyces sp. A-F 0318]|uniref:hypothetical protein n=1 Tax=Glycomyces amatae TaxID=2881355 RepID=UPI001E447D8A|nr:hypothetical protein [Glycomyces amatae]MCD0442262.1 hypothetical protein [Glycomyces amatae]